MGSIEDIIKATSHYEVLGVEPDVTDAVLRKAYLRKSLLCHPDKTRDDRATEAFQKVAEAYDVLSDPYKKMEYDLATNRGLHMPTGDAFGAGGVEISTEQAFEMFAQAMEQYAREQGIEHERQDTFFDAIASGLLYVDSFLTRHSRSANEEDDEETNDTTNNDTERNEGNPNTSEREQSSSRQRPRSRLQTWARNLISIGSIVSTASQIIDAQRERERQEEEAARMRNGQDGNGTANTENGRNPNRRHQAWENAASNGGSNRNSTQDPSSSSSSSSQYNNSQFRQAFGGNHGSPGNSK